MSVESSNEFQAVLLESVEEDIIYAIECWAQGYSGECKSEIRDLVVKCDADRQLDSRYVDAIRNEIEKTEGNFVYSELSGACRGIYVLVGLRRAVKNTIGELRGAPKLYSSCNSLLLSE